MLGFLPGMFWGRTGNTAVASLVGEPISLTREKWWTVFTQKSSELPSPNREFIPLTSSVDGWPTHILTVAGVFLESQFFESEDSEQRRELVFQWANPSDPLRDVPVSGIMARVRVELMPKRMRTGSSVVLRRNTKKRMEGLLIMLVMPTIFHSASGLPLYGIYPEYLANKG